MGSVTYGLNVTVAARTRKEQDTNRIASFLVYYTPGVEDKAHSGYDSSETSSTTYNIYRKRKKKRQICSLSKKAGFWTRTALKERN